MVVAINWGIHFVGVPFSPDLGSCLLEISVRLGLLL